MASTWTYILAAGYMLPQHAWAWFNMCAALFIFFSLLETSCNHAGNDGRNAATW